MALTTTAGGRAWHYLKHVGRDGVVGAAFSWPVSVAVGNHDLLYVACRSGEQLPTQNIAVCTMMDEKFLVNCGLDNLAQPGLGDNMFIWLTGVAVDHEEYFYGTDEWMDRVCVFDPYGDLFDIWEIWGDRPGRLDGAAGMVLGPADSLWIVSSRSSRVQQFDNEGRYLSGFHRKGRGPEDLWMPAGIDFGPDGNLYVADWGNHRVQRYRSDGSFVRTYGGPNLPAGSLKYPHDVAVDNEGDVYVADTMNHRVVVYDDGAQVLTYLEGDAVDFSKWAMRSLWPNPDMVQAIRRVPDSIQQFRKFTLPMGVTFDRNRNLLLVCDTARGRIQVYRKDNDYHEPQFNL